MHAENCGHGFDTIAGIVKTSPLQKPRCKTIHLDLPKQSSVRYIRNYQELFSMLPIRYDKQFFNHYLVKKLLENPHINAYTLTIAYLESQDLFDTYTDTQPRFSDNNISTIYARYGDALISHIISGGLHLRLYHVIANSDKTYQSLRKRFLRITTPDKLKKTLLSIQQKHPVIVKEYFSKHLGAVTTADLVESFQQSSYFDTLVSTHSTPYKYRLTSYPIFSDINQSRQKEQITNHIDQTLKDVYAMHSYQYYRHHSEDFFPISDKSKRKLINAVEKCNKETRLMTTWRTDGNQTLANSILQTIPKQYRASLPPQKTLILPTESITLDIPDFASKIEPDKRLLIRLEAHIDIQNRGQILRLHNQLSLVEKKQTHKTDTKKILYDTYVDFPGLRFQSLAQQHGTLKLDIHMTSYQQYQTVKGSGIIQSAICGYVLKTDQTMHIECKNIQYIPISPIFIHEEETKEKRRIRQYRISP